MDNIKTLLVRACRGIYDVEFRPSYSGRGMYGRSCIGIVGSYTKCMQVIGEVIKYASRDIEDDNSRDFENIVDTMLEFSQDNMGYDIIMYWENLQISEAERNDE